MNLLMSISQFFFCFPWFLKSIVLHKTINKVPLKKFLSKLFRQKRVKLNYYISLNVIQFLIHSEFVNRLDRSQAIYHLQIFHEWLYHANVNSISLVQLYIISLAFSFTFFSKLMSSVIHTSLLQTILDNEPNDSFGINVPMSKVRFFPFPVRC